ncbi:hypothetical protein PPACK8108_LOCUS24972 [Phakopsora pachyrhizi]|uniref:Uncharacterized protein n=1 Tax=Phakopsora pachyrhizi TaxID=170000 RepID=A0AAV0BSN2_PHAPC|nr:hypothetical protein PPACK8108_LOCUS24972 [Phakopsora pachyrhizi]
MIISSRSISSTNYLGRKHSSFDGLSLSYFLIQAQVRSVYRKIVRETRCLGTIEMRKETIGWIRNDLKRSPLSLIKKPFNKKIYQDEQEVKLLSYV